jgi:hypothetical protein
MCLGVIWIEGALALLESRAKLMRRSVEACKLSLLRIAFPTSNVGPQEGSAAL